MDRRVKERLIGATILVVLVVLLVPEFLSGPHRDVAPPPPASAASVRTYTVDVAHIGTAPPAPLAPPAPSSGSEPAAASTIASAPDVAPTSAVTPPPSAITPPPSAVAQPPAAAPAISAPSAAQRGWAVQLGSFASKEHAETLMRQLKAEGFSVYLSPIGSAAAKRYRVRVGPIADRAAASGVIAKLHAHRHAATLVPPTG